MLVTSPRNRQERVRTVFALAVGRERSASAGTALAHARAAETNGCADLCAWFLDDDDASAAAAAAAFPTPTTFCRQGGRERKNFASRGIVGARRG